MLILSRNINESILIDKNIKINIIKIHKNKVSIGITAPNDIKIHREEKK